MPSRSKNARDQNLRMTERRNPASKNLDRMTALEIVRLMSRQDHNVAAAVARELPAIAQAVDAIVQRLQSGGRLIYVGAGTSGRIAVLDASECPATFSTPPQQVHAVIAGGRRAIIGPVEGAEDRPHDAVRHLKKIELAPNDALVGIAASGATPYVLGAVKYANRRRALTIGISCNRDSALERAVKIAITPVVGPEVLTGSTRLKAGTAQKMVLNMLSTAAMVRLGHAYDNLMIDHGIANEKLRRRSKQILQQASSRNVSAVEHALRQSKHDLRVALVMLKTGSSAKQARKKLSDSNRNLRKALGE
ncbi:MAG TPA: N-acetylmuramic acid 6-phosphate etherase [Candidatus Acidoferrum sp.]